MGSNVQKSWQGNAFRIICTLWRELPIIPHHKDVIMSALASQITSLTIVYSTVYSRHRPKKTSKLRVTDLCAGNSPVTGEFPAQSASNAENLSIWWRHHASQRASNVVVWDAITLMWRHCNIPWYACSMRIAFVNIIGWYWPLGIISRPIQLISRTA